MSRILSVEIKNRQIKVLEGSRGRDTVTVYKSLFLDVEPGSIEDGKIIDMNSIVNVIDNGLKSKKIKSKKAIFIINSDAIITRNMELPVLKSNAETFSMVKNELDQLLPVDVNQYKIVFKMTEIVTIDGVQKGQYLVYGLPITIFEQYIELAERLKLQLVTMDLASNCLDKISGQKLILNKQNIKVETSVAFIDIGYKNISFSVINNGKNVFTKITSTSIHDIVKNFSAVFNISHEDSLTEINNLSLDDNIAVEEISKLNILVDNLNMWADEFNRYIRYYNSNNKDRQIEKIFVYGSFAKITGLTQYLESQMNIEVEEIFGISNVMSKQKENKFDVKSSLNNLLSLYMGKKDINFLSDKKKEHKSKFNASVVYMALSIIAILMVTYYGYSYVVEKDVLDKEISAMDEFINNEENIKLNNEAIQIKDNVLLLQKYIYEVEEVITAIENEDVVNTIIFEKVTASLPEGTKINSMSIDRTSIQLQCTSLSRKEVAQFERNLKQLEFIDNVHIPAVVDVTGNDNVSYSYSVVCDIEDVISNEAE